MIDFDGTLPISPDAAAAQPMASLIGPPDGAAANALVLPGAGSSGDPVLQQSSQTSGDEWIIPLLATASTGAVATGTFSLGEADLLDRQSLEGEEEQEILVTGRGYKGRSYTWDGGDGGGYTGGGSTGGGGSYYAAPVAQHAQDCGTEDGAAVQVAKHVKGELPADVSGPEDPLRTSTGNDWTKVEFGTMIVRTPNGYGAISDAIYSNDLPGDLRIQYDAAEPVVGFWHSHPGTDRSSDQRLEDRYPSIDDWNMLDRIKAGGGADSDPSLWIMDYLGTTREFKYSERDYFKNLLNEGTKMKNGDSLEGRTRSESCG